MSLPVSGKSIKPPTQAERVLRQLESAGHVAPEDFLLPDVCDGGKPILRLAPRIMELRDDGHEIDTTIRKNRVALYELAVREPTDFEVYNRHGMEGGISYRNAA